MTTNNKPITEDTKPSFEECYIEYFDRLKAAVHFLCFDEELAEEIAQESFVRLMRKWDILDRDKSVWSYLKITARHLYIDNFRKEQRKSEYLSSYTDVDYLENEYQHKELLQVLDRALLRLDPFKGAIYRDVRIHGFSYQEAANKYNISCKAVERHIAKVSQHVKRFIRRYYEEVFIFAAFYFKFLGG